MKGQEGPEVTQVGLCSDTRALSLVPGAAPGVPRVGCCGRGFSKFVSLITWGFVPCCCETAPVQLSPSGWGETFGMQLLGLDRLENLLVGVS